jgi:tight adherence protein C
VRENAIIYFGSIGLVGLAVYILFLNFFSSEEKFKTSEQLDESQDGEKRKQEDFVLRMSRPIFKRYISPVVSSLKNKKKIRENYRRNLASAGLTETLTPDDFFAFKIFLIIGFPMTFLFINEFGNFGWSLQLVPVVSVIGYFYPDLWLSGKIQERKKDIILNMPFSIDMLALSVEAGLDFIAAISKVVDKSPASALNEEFRILIKEIRIGSSRAEALRNLVWRTNIIEIASFSATLIAADSVGASIGPILKTLSEDIRARRSSEVEKQGAKAETKILGPMMVFILPAVLIIIMGPVFLEAFGFAK